MYKKEFLHPTENQENSISIGKKINFYHREPKKFKLRMQKLFVFFFYKCKKLFFLRNSLTKNLNINEQWMQFYLRMRKKKKKKKW